MAGLLYYLPGEDAQRPHSVTRERVDELGLGHAFDGAKFTPSGVHQKGPDGGSGVIVADGSRVDKIGYYPERQTWRKVGGSAVYVGHYRDQRPTAADLARAELVDGVPLKLADGDLWLIPLARGWNGSEQNTGWYHGLPRRNDVDDAGQWVPGDVLPRYKRLWEVATSWWDAKQAAIAAAALREEGSSQRGEETIGAEFDFNDFGGLNDAAAYVLSVNYRVSKTEIGLLGLFDTETAERILDATCDWNTVVAWVQKKTLDTLRADTSSTDDGPPAETPATAQP